MWFFRRLVLPFALRYLAGTTILIMFAAATPPTPDAEMGCGMDGFFEFVGLFLGGLVYAGSGFVMDQLRLDPLQSARTPANLSN